MEKIISIHQPAYLPWLGYFNKIALSDLFVILDTVQFEKNSFINRNRIKSASGPIWLTVPVKTKDKFKANILKDTEIDIKEKWQNKHLKSICLNYNKSPYFSEHIDKITNIYNKEWTKITPLCYELTQLMCNILNIKTPIVLASSISGISGEKGELVLNICKKFSATTYISGSMGKSYLNTETFKNNNIKVVFQDYKHLVYKQLYGKFEPNLSALDLIFNEGNNSLSTLMKNNNKGDLNECTCYISTSR